MNVHSSETEFAADSPLEEHGFELVWGFSCQVVFWFVGGSLFGARKSFFVPSPAPPGGRGRSAATPLC